MDAPLGRALEPVRGAALWVVGWVVAVYSVLAEVLAHWLSEGADSIAPVFLRRKQLLRAMASAASYSEWRTHALELDEIQGNQGWKMQYESPDYDYALVRDRLDSLYKARKTADWAKSAYLLRSTLYRNIGGIGNARLYKHCHVGTKDLIEQYTDEVVYQLHKLSEIGVPGKTVGDVMDMFVSIRQSYGQSALLLSGGGGLGVYHLGVVKALFDEQLLPRVISGSSAGALIGALICVTPDDELRVALSGPVPVFKNRCLLQREGEPDSWIARFRSLLRSGALADVDVLMKACQENIGNVTFEEAYLRTRRILNITVNARDMRESPRLLNYLTAPNVVIWSAACASCALEGLFEAVEVLARDKDGKLVPWNPPGQKWSDGSVQSDLPIQRLRELFNVNHFIVSQVNPHVVPVLRLPSICPRFRRFLVRELQHRLHQLASFGILPGLFGFCLAILSQQYTGHVTIIPHIQWDDYVRILSNPTDASLARAVYVGQQAAWPELGKIANHLKIELALDDIVMKLRGAEQWRIN